MAPTAPTANVITLMFDLVCFRRSKTSQQALSLSPDMQNLQRRQPARFQKDQTHLIYILLNNLADIYGLGTCLEHFCNK